MGICDMMLHACRATQRSAARRSAHLASDGHLRHDAAVLTAGGRDGGDVVDGGAPLVLLVLAVEANEVLLRVAGHLHIHT